MTRSIREARSIRAGLWSVLALLASGGFAREARADGACSTVRVPTDNAVILWDDVALQAVRRAPPGPTVVSRALAVLHTSIFDAWAAYDATAVPTVMRRGWRRPAAERTAANKSQAVSFAAYRTLVDLFPAAKTVFDALMTQLGYDASDTSLDTGTPGGVGNTAAAAVLDLRHYDGSNQLGDLHPGAYSDYTGYQAVNTPTTIVDPNRWQPLFFTTATGLATQVYTTPQWGLVTPFALTSGSALRPGPPARYPSAEYASQAADLVALSAGLTDFQKITAEYFADGPSSEFPPGHWAIFAQFVSERDGHTLDDDVRMFFALSNALLDAGIVAWDAKLFYDSERPSTAIHFLYAGQTIQAWGGPYQGTRTIRGEDWQPYQLASVVTPPFPEYFSGHSVFSAAGAEVLKSFVGNDTLGCSATVKKGTSIGEPGLVPTTDVTLSFPTFSDAANAAGMSRRWGGIHFAQGDLTGRSLGRVIGAMVWTKARTYFDGTAYRSEAVPTREPHPPVRAISR
jgi:hypothetical protein